MSGQVKVDDIIEMIDANPASKDIEQGSVGDGGVAVLGFMGRGAGANQGARWHGGGVMCGVGCRGVGNRG